VESTGVVTNELDFTDGTFAWGTAAAPASGYLICYCQAALFPQTKCKKEDTWKFYAVGQLFPYASPDFPFTFVRQYKTKFSFTLTLDATKDGFKKEDKVAIIADDKFCGDSALAEVPAAAKYTYTNAAADSATLVIEMAADAFSSEFVSTKALKVCWCRTGQADQVLGTVADCKASLTAAAKKEYYKQEIARLYVGPFITDHVTTLNAASKPVDYIEWFSTTTPWYQHHTVRKAASQSFQILHRSTASTVIPAVGDRITLHPGKLSDNPCGTSVTPYNKTLTVDAGTTKIPFSPGAITANVAVTNPTESDFSKFAQGTYIICYCRKGLFDTQEQCNWETKHHFSEKIGFMHVIDIVSLPLLFTTQTKFAKTDIKIYFKSPAGNTDRFRLIYYPTATSKTKLRYCGQYSWSSNEDTDREAGDAVFIKTKSTATTSAAGNDHDLILFNMVVNKENVTMPGFSVEYTTKGTYLMCYCRAASVSAATSTGSPCWRTRRSDYKGWGSGRRTHSWRSARCGRWWWR
jgi:hypothetical protein